MYDKGQWPGFYMIWLDWEGNRWMIQHICKWYKGDFPEWLFIEDISDPDIDLDELSV